jgi:hypothetical protein
MSITYVEDELLRVESKLHLLKAAFARPKYFGAARSPATHTK